MPASTLAAVPDPGPVPFDRVHGLRDTNIAARVQEYLETAALIKTLEEGQVEHRQAILSLLQNAGVKSVSAGAGIATVVKGKVTTKIDRKALLKLAGPDVLAKVTISTEGEPTVRIAPAAAQEGEQE